MEKNKSNSDEEKSINRYFGLVVPYIIFLGMIRLIVYYNEFGVSIVSYLDISEVITSFFDILMIIVIIFVSTTFNSFLLSDKKKNEKITNHRTNILKEENEWKIAKLYFLYLKFPILILLGFIIVTLLSHLFFHWFNYWELIFFPSILIVLILYIIIGLEIERKHQIYESSPGEKRYIGLIFYSFILVLTVSLYSKYQARQVAIHHSTKGTTILLNNGEKIVSNKQRFFIGKTTNYIFFFDTKTNTTEVFPISEIKMLKIKKNIK